MRTSCFCARIFLVLVVVLVLDSLPRRSRFSSVRGERDRACEICPTRQTLKSGKAAYEVVPKTGAGGKVVGWLDLHSFPLYDNVTGQLGGVIEYVRDITARKRAEDHWILSRLSRAIREVTGHLEGYRPSAAITAAWEFFWGSSVSGTWS